nr:DUF3309 family protein [Granulicella mallensis]
MTKRDAAGGCQDAKASRQLIHSCSSTIGTIIVSQALRCLISQKRASAHQKKDESFSETSRRAGFAFFLKIFSCRTRKKHHRGTGRTFMLIILLILLLVFGFGGYRMGPGLGYYGGGGISLILLIVIILLLLKVF